jgi:hypothetical protein
MASLILFLLLPSLEFGEIYGWIDENGVKHFSNDPPPEGTKAFIQTREVSTGKAKGRKIEKTNKQYSKELKQKNRASGATSAKTATATPGEDNSDEVIIQEFDSTFHKGRRERRVRKNHRIEEEHEKKNNRPEKERERKKAGPEKERKGEERMQHKVK